MGRKAERLKAERRIAESGKRKAEGGRGSKR
jgi:hypothetical protein